MVQFADALTLDAPRRTKDGFMAVRARVARAGVYRYTGSEIDATGATFKADQIVNVYRSPEEVFAADSVASFLGKPVTNDHPAHPVTADNWKAHARGGVMKALRDGEHLAFDLAIMDADTIAAIDAGKRELSNGYSCDLVIGDGVAPDGTAYQARQTNIRGNHVAVVDAGRAGSSCRIGDTHNRFAVCDANTAALGSFTSETEMKKITLDGGLLLDLADADAVAAAITKFRTDAATAATALTDAQTQVSTLTGEKAALEKQLADANSKIDPAAIDKLVADRATFVVQAKALKPDVITDGKAVADIRREIVAAKLGDAAKDMDDAGIAGAFAVLAKDSAKGGVVNIVPGSPVSMADSVSKARQARLAAMSTAYRPQAA